MNKREDEYPYLALETRKMNNVRVGGYTTARTENSIFPLSNKHWV
jgi:hypothetical protein